MKKIYIVVLFLCSLSGFSQEWIFVGKNSKMGKTSYIKNDYESYSNEFLTIWEKSVYDIYEYSGVKYYNAQVLCLLQFDMKSKRFKPLRVLLYDENGIQIFNMNIDTLTEWQELIPGTFAETEYNYIKDKIFK